MTPNEMDALAWIARRLEWETTVEELHARNARRELKAETAAVAASTPAPAPVRRFGRRRRTSPVRGMSGTPTVATMQQ